MLQTELDKLLAGPYAECDRRLRSARLRRGLAGMAFVNYVAGMKQTKQESPAREIPLMHLLPRLRSFQRSGRAS